MPVPELLPGQQPARDDVQQTAFTYDVMGRYVCNTWDEVMAAQGMGGYPFDAIVIGGGMFGSYCAEKLYRLGAPLALRILILEAGGFLISTHIQDLPQQLGGKVGGPNYLRTRDDASGTQNVVWGMPWISNERFPGLAYCVGGRSLFWGGWSPALTDADLMNWPNDVVTHLKSSTGYSHTADEIGTSTTTDYISTTNLYTALLSGLTTAMASVTPITEVKEAPLAVQGASPRSGLFSFDKFSSAPFLIDALRNDIGVNNDHGDVSRRIFLVPRVQVHRLITLGNTVTGIDLSVNGARQTLPVAPTCGVVLANGTIEATRLALESFGIGSMQFGSPRVGNLMAHLRSNITVRIKRTALGLTSPPTDLETVALIVRGTTLGRRFHHQVTAASLAGPNPEQNMWSMAPDIDVIQNLLLNQDPNWVVITFRGIGEMEDQRSLNPDPARSWIDMSSENDQFGMRRAYVNLVGTQNDRTLWAAMDKSAFDLAKALAMNPANIQYWNSQTIQWQPNQPQPDANGRGFWQDSLGTTHHEAGTLFMGNPGASITDTNGKFHNIANAYVAGPALFPTLGSANPSLTALTLARRTAGAIVQAANPLPQPGLAPLSLSPSDWQMVRLPNSPAAVKHYGQVLETTGYYGLYWYIKEQFSNFALSVQWRIGRRDDNSGVYFRIPPPNLPDALNQADTKGHEIQIDQRGYDSLTNTEGNPLKVTGAIYDLQAPSAPTAVPIGAWNSFLIEANGPKITVTLNGQVVNVYQSSRQLSGYIALQAHHDTSRVQFRNLQIKKLP